MLTIFRCFRLIKHFCCGKIYIIFIRPLLMFLLLFLSPHFPLVVPFTQSTYAARVFLMFPQHGKYFPTSGPLHLLTSSHDMLLPKPQTTFLAYIRNVFKRCLSMWVFLTMIVFNLRTPSFHHHQILCVLSLLYFMLLSFRITLCFQVGIFRLSPPTLN